MLHPGMAVWRIHAVGAEAHAGNAHARGRNAIAMLAPAITSLENLTDYNFDDLGGITVNVGSVSGGTAHNTVPGHCEALFEMRARSLDAFAEGVRRVEQTLVEHTDLVVTQQRLVQPWGQHAGTIGLAETWTLAAEELSSLGDVKQTLLSHPWAAVAPEQCSMSIETENRGGLSDGNWLWQQYPTLDGLGVSGMHAHCSGPHGEAPVELMHWNSVAHKALLNCAGLLRLAGA